MRENAARILDGERVWNDSRKKMKLTQRLLSLGSVYVYFVAIDLCQLSCCEEKMYKLILNIKIVTISKKVKWKF